ncbi:hypothetical protein C0991_005162 [Blastosporella zonata]|nr:hypothetical protein C0991_005162 [Blastosporella zonata]
MPERYGQSNNTTMLLGELLTPAQMFALPICFRDTANHPVNITNRQGLIQLRKSGETTPVILASGFSILLGRIEIEVPWVIDGDDYQLVLFGDSGNFSPTFTITGSVEE